MAFPCKEDYRDLIEALPEERGHRLYRGFWFNELSLPGIMHFQQNFIPRDADIYLMSYPKCGTTWIKALAFSVLNRKSFTFRNHPILTTHPQNFAPSLETFPSFTEPLPSRRLLASHVPYSLLPESMKTYGLDCRMIYVSRDPKDAFVSMWHFYNEITQGTADMSLDEAFVNFCDGPWGYGPLWDHQMEYMRESRRRPEKVLFLNYEEMKESPEDHVMRIGEFLGMPFSEVEKRGGAVEEIVKLCSFDFLKELEVNREGILFRLGDMVFKNSDFFRKGKVGDWKHHLTAEMGERVDKITKQKLQEYGFE